MTKLKKLTFRRLLNALILYWGYALSLLFGNTRRLAYPISLSVEPVAGCNLSCVQCPVGMQQLERPEGQMDFQLFKKIIDETAPHILSLILYFQGEPYMSKHFFRFAEYAAKDKNIYTVSSTNGHFLTEKNCQKTIESGLDELIISLDGMSQEVYESYRRGGKADVVLQNIERLTAMKKAFGVKHPKVIIQTLLLKSNRHEIEQIREFSEKVGVDKFESKTAQFYNYEQGHELMLEDARHSRYIKNAEGRWRLKGKLKNRCRRLWETSVISWEGDVLPCCFDKDARHSFGNITNDSFRNINNNAKARAFRKKILTDRAGIEMCRNCSEV